MLPTLCCGSWYNDDHARVHRILTEAYLCSCLQSLLQAGQGSAKAPTWQPLQYREPCKCWSLHLESSSLSPLPVSAYPILQSEFNSLFQGKPSLILNIPTPTPCHCTLPLRSLTRLTVVSVSPSVPGGPAGDQHALRQETLSMRVGPVNE